MTARLTIAAAFVATVIGANAALTRWGIVPVGLGLEAPAGVYFAGLAFGLRDALHEVGGRPWVLAAIAAGAVASYAIEDGAGIPGGHAPVAVASASAFALSELADLAVYAPLRARSWPVAVAASNLAGAVVDSTLFLWLAFGTLDHLGGNIVGKTATTLLTLPIVWRVRRALPRYGLRVVGD